MGNKRGNIARFAARCGFAKRFKVRMASENLHFRSNKHVYAQVISDNQGVTLASVSTLSKDLLGTATSNKGVSAAKQVGIALAKVCKEKNITRAVFDRNGFLYHGQVKAVADGARKGRVV